MSYQPVIPASGVAGWTFLARTRAAQTAAFDNSAAIRRDTEYFERTIGSITSAEDLVADRRLLRVALGAFGLGEDINSRFFIRKVLSEGTLSGKGLANRLSDTRYYEMSKSFGFGDVSPPHTVISDFGPRITALYREREFEAAVGSSQPELRLALSLDRDLGGLAERDISEAAMWYTVLATPPLRAVFETALSVPTVAAGLDIDKQAVLFRDKARAVLGTSDLSVFADPGRRDGLRQIFLARSQLSTVVSGQSAGSVALALLQSATLPINGR